MAHYLGIDGGGSKTICAVGEEVSLLSTAETGPSNITRVGEARARETLHQAIQEACAAARIAPRQVRRACIGVAGAGREEIASTVRQIVAELILGEIEVVGDMQIALAAAFGERPGVIVIAGTGSIAYGRDAQGRTARAGGWGFAISDEGSAHWIGRTAVSRLFRTVDQNSNDREEAPAQSPRLYEQLKAAWKVDSLGGLVQTANSSPDFAALFPAILAAADAGDELALSVLTTAGEELATLAAIVVQRLAAKSAVTEVGLSLSMAGGVFRHSSQVRESFGNEVRKIDRNVNLNPQVIDPVHGALQMARSHQT